MSKTSEIFLEIVKKCRQPSIAILREALQVREKLSISESNFITYMAGFSHYEFSESLFDEFKLISIADETVVFDHIHEKYHFKVLLNDLLYLPCFSNLEGYDENDNEIYSDKYFSNFIIWRNKDGSYVNNSYQERKGLDKNQYQKYCEDHIIGLQEDVFPHEFIHAGKNFVANITTVQKNILNNLSIILNRTNSCIFIHSSDEAPFTSLYKLQENKPIHSLLSKITWYILDTETSHEAKTFFDNIGANSILIPYQGEKYDFEYDYSKDFMSAIVNSVVEKISSSNQIFS
jgi:hypothetical protein